MLGSLQDKMAQNDKKANHWSPPRKGVPMAPALPMNRPAQGFSWIMGQLYTHARKLERDMIEINKFDGIVHKNGTEACMHL